MKLNQIQTFNSCSAYKRTRCWFIEYIHKRLVEQRDLGKAVLLVSLELDEVLNVSDRIAVVNNGELVGIVNANETNENEVGLMMAGVKKEEA